MRRILFLAGLAILGILLLWALHDPAAPDPLAEAGPQPIAEQAAATAEAAAAQASRVKPAREEVASAAAASTRAGPALIGRVADAAGQPIAGARVVCEERLLGSVAKETRPEALAAATTEADGTFRIGFAPEPKHGLQLRVAARGWQRLQRWVRDPDPEGMDLGTLTLEAGAVVSGHIVDRMQQPVAGAVLTLVPHVAGEAAAEGVAWAPIDGPDRSAGDGSFELAHARPGSFTLLVAHPSHPSARLEGQSVAPGEARAGLVVVLELGVAISGQVVGVPKDAKLTACARCLRPAQTGPDQADPFSEALGLDRGERQCPLDAEGRFSLRGLDASQRYRVWAQADAGRLLQAGCCTEPRDAPAGAEGLVLAYRPGVLVKARAVDARNDAPIERLSVRPELRRSEGFFAGIEPVSAGDFPSGAVNIGPLRPGPRDRLTLRVEAVGYAAWERRDLALPASGVLELGAIPLTPWPIVRVRVTSAATGAPLQASVDLRESGRESLEAGPNESRTGVTDADGWCCLTSYPGKRASLTVYCAGHASYRAELDLPSDEGVEQQVRLGRGARIDVLVLDTQDTPVRQAAVLDQGPIDMPVSRTDDRGVARFRAVVPGRHRLTVRLGRGFDAPARADAPLAAHEAELEVSEGERLSITLVKPMLGTVTGVVREGEVALGNASLVVLRPESGPAAGELGPASPRLSPMAWAATGAEGRFQLTDLVPGKYRLRVQHPARAMPTERPIEVRAGEQSVTVDLAASMVKGRVLDEAGEPVAGARVGVELERGASAEGSLWLHGVHQSHAAAKTGPDGTYELRGVEAGVPLVVSVKAKGFVPVRSGPGTVAAGTTQTWPDLRLERGGRIVARVDGKSLFARVRATREGEQAQETPVQNGSADLDGLRPGRWQVRLVTMAQGHEPVTVEVRLAETTEVRLGDG